MATLTLTLVVVCVALAVSFFIGALSLIFLSVNLTLTHYLRKYEDNRYFLVLGPLDVWRLIKQIYSKGGDYSG